MKKLIYVMSLLTLLVAGCTTVPPADRRVAEKAQITELAASIRALGPEVDPEEAERAARIAYSHTHELAIQYQITDPPLIHNTKVNMGLRPRGLCWHWAEDIENRLKQENFQTLDLHRAIANSDNPFRIEHSTAIVSRKGDSMFDGIVLDPWRKGGILHWTPTRTDTDYNWLPRQQVFEAKRERLRARQRLSTQG
ncbi:hypothetical protein [Thalassococcus sp. S3]|uniref:hypothetical protein n=1 Tax=Thalassococcus sp. S3 TaxID=2017482 RepID=UPI0010249282|nr:hypothetical protein [Thalassococcus sp. S3]QBF29734.1 hypothetical protein CFI11_00695 [Thalassococcus sp. S3]